MNKIDLFAQLPAYPTNPKALALARLSLSDKDIEKLVATLTNREKTLGLFARFQLLLTVVFLCSEAVAVAQGYTLTMADGLITLAVVFGPATLEWYFRKPLALLPQLAPVRGTDLCEKALEFVSSGGPNVATWRDIALAERNQLYSFDYNLMYLLAAQHQALHDRKTRQEALDKACRALHLVA
jgi:hypothetical protein